VLNALSLLLWINAVISVLVLFGHGLFIAGELLAEGDLRETTGPFMVVGICGFAFFMAVWPRERDQQMTAVGIDLFLFFICGVAGVAAANSDEQFSGGGDCSPFVTLLCTRESSERFSRTLAMDADQWTLRRRSLNFDVWSFHRETAQSTPKTFQRARESRY
jgi:hypothetical protein